jgi:glyoxylase-like metal-dependent hydrolase (beta-lactamase superfamily II)
MCGIFPQVRKTMNQTATASAQVSPTDLMAGEKALSFPHGTTLPELGQALEVAPGILWIRMALPFALDHINLWLLADTEETSLGLRHGWTAVDCGVTNPGTQEAWRQVFAGPMKGLPILRVVVTHMHPDHMGLAHWLCEQFSAPLYMNATEYQAALLASTGASNFGGLSTQRFFADHGWNDPADQQQVQSRVSYYANMVPKVPESYHRLMQGSHLEIGGHTWECISGWGHSPEHMALYSASANVLISGDMVLPKISTNVSVYAQEPEANALALFMRSLKKFDVLPTDALVLPSHGRPFVGVHTRTAQLLKHHQDRLEEVLSACTEHAGSAHDMLKVIFKRPLDFHQTTFAIGESVAHLHALWYEGKMKRFKDEAGVWRFQTLSECLSM